MSAAPSRPGGASLPGCLPGAPTLAGPPRDQIVVVSPAANLSTLRAAPGLSFIYVSSGIRRLTWRFLGMAGPGVTASAGFRWRILVATVPFLHAAGLKGPGQRDPGARRGLGRRPQPRGMS